MKKRIALALAVVCLIPAFVFLAPVLYVPAAPPSDCNFSCALGGHAAYYASMGQSLWGVGACYWPPTDYYIPC